MRVFVDIEICRNSDKVTVAKLTKAVEGPITRSDADAIRKEAERLSVFYGPTFHVEVWAWWPDLGGDAYHRAYVYMRGVTVSAVGF